MSTSTIKKATFASTIGMILATAGSAVGLGNIWRFPTMTGENGGAAFIMIYMIFNVLIGFVGMVAEFTVGRHSGLNPVRAYIQAGGEKEDGTMRKHSNLWGIMGIVGALCTSLVLSFYSVVAGWCIYYLFLAFDDMVLGTPDFVSNTFGRLIGQDGIYTCCSISVIFILLTFFIVERGVQKGIERASKIMVPGLFVLLIILGIASCSLPGASAGLEYLFMPDLSKVTWHTVFEAMSHSFFSLSLGTACLCTYASYMKHETNLAKSALEIACIDVGVAIMAGIMIFPAAFSVGVQPDSGPSLIFITLPNVFTQAFPHTIAYVISILFYALLVLAALTSTISMLEIGTVVMEQELHLTRRMAALIETLFCCIVGGLCALSFAHPEIGIAGKTLFDNCDYITAKFFMPLGGMVTCILVGWIMSRESVMAQLTNYFRLQIKPWVITLFYFLVRFVCPILIGIIFILNLV